MSRGIQMQKNTSRILLLILLVLATGASFLVVKPSQTVLALVPTPSDDEVNAIASQLFCPVCENTPLDVCPTEACRQWRDLIRQMLAEGKSESEIEKYFVENYGARVLSEPPRQGLNWLVYIVPPVAFLAGAYLLFRAFRAWKKLATESDLDQANKPDSKPAEADEYSTRFEEELKKRR